MTLLQLSYIMEIYKSGSMNKAAKNLFLSQSTISNAIKEVEEELGIVIFNRTNRGITLTEDGREFIAQIRPILEQDKKIRRYYANRSKDEAMRFAVSSQRYPFCTKAFVEFLSNQTIEAYEFKLLECDINQVIDDVSRRRSEIGVLYYSDMTEKYIQKVLSANSLEYRLLKEIRPCAFLNKSHPLAQKQEVSIKELSSYPCVVFEKNEDSPLYFAEEVGLTDKYEFEKTILINDRATAYNIMAHTEAFSTGSGVLPDGYSDVNLCAVPISDELDYMRLGYIKIEDAALSDKAKEYLKILKTVLEDEQR